MTMFLSQTSITHKAFLPPSFVIGDTKLNTFVSISSTCPTFKPLPCTHSHSNFYLPSRVHHGRNLKLVPSFSVSRKSDSEPDPEPNSKPKAKPEKNSSKPNTRVSKNEDENPKISFPTIKPRKPRRGRRSEAVAVEDFVRDSLERTFESIRQKQGEDLENKENIMKERKDEETDSDSSDIEDDDDDDGDDNDKNEKKMVVEEDDPDWPVDADVGWGLSASEYFEKHSVKNVTGDDGVEINWEGEMDDSWVEEINCLEWESFAFHPSPLIVLVFERYKRPADNWKALKELEKAVQVYWGAKDRLPPRTVKLDINIEKDLAYALNAKEGPQTLFLRGDKILYREKEVRSSDELVKMIAHFYYNAKKPSWIDDRYLAPRSRRF